MPSSACAGTANLVAPSTTEFCNTGACPELLWASIFENDACSTLCGGFGTARLAPLQCLVNGVQAASDDTCESVLGFAPPSGTVTCGGTPCTNGVSAPLWRVNGTWSQCVAGNAAAGCGLGTTQRSVQCVTYNAAGVPTVVADSACDAALKPTVTMACDAGACTCDTAADCPAAVYSGNAVCDDNLGKCTCNALWAGPSCSVPVFTSTTAGTCASGVVDVTGACCAGYTDADTGRCCAAGSRLDHAGRCCASHVDACGVCGGAGVAVDVEGECCDAPLGADGSCCFNGIDDCGVCGGNNMCAATATLTVATPSVNTTAIVAAFAAGLGVPDSVEHVQLSLDATAGTVVTVVVQPAAARSNGAIVAAGLSVPSAAVAPTVTRHPSCGNGVCEVGERNTCGTDCPVPAFSCPVSTVNGEVCGRAGVCQFGLGTCQCAAGYVGAACDECDPVTATAMPGLGCVPYAGNQVSCFDGVKNGDELQADCGGQHCGKCLLVGGGETVPKWAVAVSAVAVVLLVVGVYAKKNKMRPSPKKRRRAPPLRGANKVMPEQPNGDDGDDSAAAASAAGSGGGGGGGGGGGVLFVKTGGGGSNDTSSSAAVLVDASGGGGGDKVDEVQAAAPAPAATGDASNDELPPRGRSTHRNSHSSHRKRSSSSGIGNIDRKRSTSSGVRKDRKRSTSGGRKGSTSSGRKGSTSSRRHTRASVGEVTTDAAGAAGTQALASVPESATAGDKRRDSKRDGESRRKSSHHNRRSSTRRTSRRVPTQADDAVPAPSAAVAALSDADDATLGATGATGTETTTFQVPHTVGEEASSTKEPTQSSLDPEATFQAMLDEAGLELGTTADLREATRKEREAVAAAAAAAAKLAAAEAAAAAVGAPSHTEPNMARTEPLVSADGTTEAADLRFALSQKSPTRKGILLSPLAHPKPPLATSLTRRLEEGDATVEINDGAQAAPIAGKGPRVILSPTAKGGDLILTARSEARSTAGSSPVPSLQGSLLRRKPSEGVIRTRSPTMASRPATAGRAISSGQLVSPTSAARSVTPNADSQALSPSGRPKTARKPHWRR